MVWIYNMNPNDGDTVNDNTYQMDFFSSVSDYH